MITVVWVYTNWYVTTRHCQENTTMTTAYFRSTSNDVEVTDKEQVAKIIDEYELPREVDSIMTGNKITIHTPDMMNYGFHVRKETPTEHNSDATTELYERIAPYLTEPLKINTVQVVGAGNSNMTRIVHPNGDIENKDHTPR